MYIYYQFKKKPSPKSSFNRMHKNCYTYESIENVSGFKGSDFDFYFLCVAMANNIMHVIYYFNCLPNWA